MGLLIIIVLVGLSVSAVCSVLEASLLSVSTVKLAERAKTNRGSALLLKYKNEQLDDSIGAILTYNTIAHTVGAALSGAQAGVVFGDAWVGVFSGILTLMILVFTEIIPKTIGTVYSLRVSGFVGQTLRVMLLPPMSWLLKLTSALTGLITRGDGAGHHNQTTRRDVRAAIKLAREQGSLHEGESRVLDSMLSLQEIKISDIMTPRSVMVMFEESISLAEAITDDGAGQVSRVPVYQETKDQVVGYVLMREVLFASIARSSRDVKLLDAVELKPLPLFGENLPAGTALKSFTSLETPAPPPLALVADEHGMTGLVTLEDVIETILGVEIVDETDSHTDLRKRASELRDERMRHLRDNFEHRRRISGAFRGSRVVAKTSPAEDIGDETAAAVEDAPTET